jgi:methionyl-tRNA formyltransferase
MASRLRIAFFGSGAFGLPTLRALSAAHDLALIVTQPDKPAGRGSKLTATPIGDAAAREFPGVPLLKPADINTPDMLAAVRDGHGQVDAWVIIAFGQKLSVPLLQDRFAINLHASLLPRWRGAAPIHAAILAGDLETGNSVITLAQRMDAGLVLGTSRRPILATQTTAELHDLLAEDGAPVVLRVLAQHTEGTLQRLTQDETLATRARKLSRDDAWVDFADAGSSARRVHALNPWPGVAVRLQPPGANADASAATSELEELKLWRVAIDSRDATHRQAPGTLLDADAGLVACAAGTLRLIEVQSPGKKAMSWADLQRGRRFATGTRLIGRQIADDAGGGRS